MRSVCEHIKAQCDDPQRGARSRYGAMAQRNKDPVANGWHEWVRIASSCIRTAPR
jgi:hypothetical protein